MNTYEEHCTYMEQARGTRECIDTGCAGCNQKAEQVWSRERWKTWRCDVCDAPLCSRCHTRTEDEGCTHAAAPEKD